MVQNEDTDNSENQSLLLSLSGQATKDLLALILERGYLHEKVEAIQGDPKRGNPKKESPSDLPVYTSEDPNCQVVLLDNEENDTRIPCCCTYPVLEKKLNEKLEERGGRSSISELFGTLRLHDEKPLLRILSANNNKDDKDLFQVGNDIVSSCYLDRKSEQVFTSLLSEEKPGYFLLSELATQEFHLPMDFVLGAIEARLPEGIQILSLEAGTTIASDNYLVQLKKEVLEFFSDLTEPALVSSICQKNHWDSTLVTPWVRELCQDGKLLGDLHGGSDNSSATLGAMYTPHAHVQAQRQSVDDLFATQGYMTATRGIALGLSKSKMGEYIQETFPYAVVISESLFVNPEVIVSPLEAVLQEAISSETFVDLQDHIALDILEQEQDARSILNEHVLPKLMKQHDDSKSSKKKKKPAISDQPQVLGVPVVSSNHGGIFVSAGMIQKIKGQMLSELIGKYAKGRAEQIDSETVGSGNVAHYSKASSSSSKKKGGRKAKRGSKQEENDSITVEETQAKGSSNVVPLTWLVRRIIEEYPELAEVDGAVKEHLDDNITGFSWENSQGETGADSLLCELCRVAFYTEDFVTKCQSAIDTEVRQLQSSRLSKASLSRKDAATKVRNTESAFEETFNTACYMLQCHEKFLQYVENAETIKEEDKGNALLREELRTEILQGCSADFTSRLTQYCIFKNEVDRDKFCFSPDSANSAAAEKEGQDSALPLYCTPTDLAIREYPPTFLSFKDTEEAEGKARGPLPKLREELPGSIGVSLARQWTFLGGSCYDGGIKIDEDGNEIKKKPGDLDKFMTHVEENCLSVCGYPFKKLDKKSEKQFLFSRRQRLLQLLEVATDAGDVLNFTIMLLFQQVKNLVVTGKHLRSDILTLLLSERKIDQDVASTLTELAQVVKEGSDVKPVLMETVRNCGLSRDISKHKVEE